MDTEVSICTQSIEICWEVYFQLGYIWQGESKYICTNLLNVLDVCIMREESRDVGLDGVWNERRVEVNIARNTNRSEEGEQIFVK